MGKVNWMRLQNFQVAFSGKYLHTFFMVLVGQELIFREGIYGISYEKLSDILHFWGVEITTRPLWNFFLNRGNSTSPKWNKNATFLSNNEVDGFSGDFNARSPYFFTITSLVISTLENPKNCRISFTYFIITLRDFAF